MSFRCVFTWMNCPPRGYRRPDGTIHLAHQITNILTHLARRAPCPRIACCRDDLVGSPQTRPPVDLLSGDAPFLDRRYFEKEKVAKLFLHFFDRRSGVPFVAEVPVRLFWSPVPHPPGNALVCPDHSFDLLKQAGIRCLIDRRPMRFAGE